MILYRVERFDKVGPYQITCPGTDAQRNSKCSTGVDHPMPFEDKGLKGFQITQDHHFAFCSMEQLKDWWPDYKWDLFVDFNQTHATIPERHLGISEYEVPPEYVEIGDKQVVFKMSEAERLNHTPFSRELIMAEI